MTSTEVRPRQPSDLPALVSALKDVYLTDGYPPKGVSDASNVLSPHGTLSAWVAIHAGSIVGQIVVIDGRAIGEIELVVGRSGHRAALQAWLDRGGEMERTVLAARLFVCRSARGTGLGRGLVEEACKWARERGLKVIINVLDNELEGSGAKRLYERVGFVRIGEGIYGGGEKPVRQFFYVDGGDDDGTLE